MVQIQCGRDYLLIIFSQKQPNIFNKKDKQRDSHTPIKKKSCRGKSGSRLWKELRIFILEITERLWVLQGKSEDLGAL